MLPVIGLNTAVISIAGQNYGAKNYDRVRETYTTSMIFGFVFMTLAGVFIYFTAHFFMSKFTDDLEVIAAGVYYLQVAAFIGPIYPTFLEVFVSDAIKALFEKTFKHTIKETFLFIENVFF